MTALAHPSGPLWSDLAGIPAPAPGAALAEILAARATGKALLAESGWTFLANDTADFLGYYFGARAWGQAECDAAVRVLSERRDRLGAAGRAYVKLIVPEKAVIYPEFLPRALAGLPVSPDRPALRIAAAGLPDVHYLAPLLTDAKGWGPLYFRGDTHTNWTGAFFVYLAALAAIEQATGRRDAPPLRLRDLTAEMIRFGGDIFAQLGPAELARLDAGWAAVSHGPDCAEMVIRLALPEALRRARPVAPPDAYAATFTERPVLAYEGPAGLPRAVIFRDSTATHLTDLLAQHFSRSVFIWHRGLVYEDLIAREAPDIVLHIMAERFMIRYAANRAFHRAWP